MLAINNVADRIHLFIGMTPCTVCFGLMRIVKPDSTKWINSQRLGPHKFSWQEGFGAFSYFCSHIDHVVRYIHDQQKHHAKSGFIHEYRSLLDHFGIVYEEKYLFREPQ